MITIGSFVVSLCGRDEGNLMIVVDIKDGYLFVCDGKERKVERPKKKNVKHTVKLDYFDESIESSIESRTLSNSQARNALRRAAISLQIE